MYRLGFVLALLTASAGPAPAASPDPRDLAIPAADLARARELVRKLGSEDFGERERAQEGLEKMGRLAKPALAEAVGTHPSAEVRFRCQVLLPKAAAEDLQARLAAFLADADGKFEHDLPGWDEFRLVAGPTRTARAVFKEWVVDPANGDLVLAVGGPPEHLGNLVAARKQELYNLRIRQAANAPVKEPAAKDVVALLFADSQVASRYVPRSVSTTVLLSSPAVTAAVTDPGEQGQVYKAVVARWIDTRDDPTGMYQAIAAAGNLGLGKEATGVAARLLGTKAAPGPYRGQAAMTLARFGGPEQLPALEGCLTDETPVLTIRLANAQQVNIQVRDAALVASLLLTDQKPEEYGFVERFRVPAADAPAASQFSYSRWYLPDDRRAAAFEKWKAWREKNPVAANPDPGPG